MSHNTKNLVNVNGVFTIPKNKPDMEFVLRATVLPYIDSASTIFQKVIFRGHLDLCIEYVARTADCSQPVYFVNFKLPFNSGVIEQCRIKAGMKVQLQAKAEYLSVDALDCRCVDCVAVVKVAIVKLGNCNSCLPPHVCLPYFSPPILFCGGKCAPEPKPDDCQPDCHPDCPPCHQHNPCDCDPCGCDPCDSDPCDNSINVCSITPAVSCDCMSDITSANCGVHSSAVCECMTCNKAPETYYRDSYPPHTSVGT